MLVIMNVVDYVLLLSHLLLWKISCQPMTCLQRDIFSGLSPRLVKCLWPKFFLWRELGTEANRLSHGIECYWKKGMVEIASIAQHVVMKNELGITKWMLWSFLERTIALAKHPATKTDTLPSWELAYPFPKVVLKMLFPFSKVGPGGIC